MSDKQTKAALNETEVRVTLLPKLDKLKKKFGGQNRRKCLLCSACVGVVVVTLISCVLFVCFADSAYTMRQAISEQLGIKLPDYQTPATLRKLLNLQTHS